MSEDNITLDPEGDLMIIATMEITEPVEAVTDAGTADDAETAEPTEAVEITKTTSVRSFIASSKHLELASRRFKRMLNGPWRENQPSPEGLRYWNLEVVDLDAFTVALRIIHSRHREIRARVSLPFLANIAIIADDLQCNEALQPWADLWTVELRKSFPHNGYPESIPHWVLIAQVFYCPVLFRQATHAAIVEVCGNFESPDLPIRHSLAEAISAKRIDLLSFLFDCIRTLMETVRRCAENSDDPEALENLTNLIPWTVHEPLPEPPYEGRTVQQTIKLLNSLYTWCRCVTSPSATIESSRQEQDENAWAEEYETGQHEEPRTVASFLYGFVLAANRRCSSFRGLDLMELGFTYYGDTGKRYPDFSTGYHI